VANLSNRITDLQAPTEPQVLDGRYHNRKYWS
jgi:hypothetical protein